MKKWREDNKEHLKEYGRKYHKKYYPKNREKLLEYYKKWREENKEYKNLKDREYNSRKRQDEKWVEKERKRGREYYRKRAKLDPGFANRQFKERYRNDPEFNLKKRRYAVKYAKKHKEKKMVWVNNYSARKRNAEGSFTTDEWEKLLEKNNHSCIFCGTKERLSIDHIIPLSKNGTNYIWNIQPLCRSCNSKKSNKVLLNT